MNNPQSYRPGVVPKMKRFDCAVYEWLSDQEKRDANKMIKDGRLRMIWSGEMLGFVLIDEEEHRKRLDPKSPSTIASP